MIKMAGTVAISNGGTTITGTETFFVGSIFAGDSVSVDRQHWYRVTADAVSDTSVTFEPTFAETGVSNVTLWVQPTGQARLTNVAWSAALGTFNQRYSELLTTAGADRRLKLNKAATGDYAEVQYLTGGSAKFRHGTLAGGEFALQGYSAGWVDLILTSTLKVTFPNAAGVSVLAAVDATAYNAAALTIPNGGLGVAGHIFCNGHVYVNGSDGGFYVGRRDTGVNAAIIYSAAGNLSFYMAAIPDALVINASTGYVTIASSDGADSTAHGALRVNGGAGFGGSVWVGVDVNVNSGTPAYRYFKSGAQKWVTFVDGGQNFVVYDTVNSSGLAVAPAGSSWSAYSDRRVKDQIAELSVLDMLPEFRAIRFRNKITGRMEIGAIAQEQNALFPEFVTAGIDDDDMEPEAFDDLRMWRLAYDRYGVVALQGVKELLARVGAIESQLAH